MSMLTDEHKKLGVDFDGEKFFVRDGDQTYNYTKLEDAVNYAKSLAREDSPARDNSAQEQAELRAKEVVNYITEVKIFLLKDTLDNSTFWTE